MPGSAVRVVDAATTQQQKLAHPVEVGGETVKGATGSVVSGTHVSTHWLKLVCPAELGALKLEGAPDSAVSETPVSTQWQKLVYSVCTDDHYTVHFHLAFAGFCLLLSTVLEVG